ncbi:DNA circularization protein [Methylomonas sp. 11b]|uniref:DNA circularization protein n=1 Tax=Methylomonas sp. 11b TaxID=1168169 RepID=UPI00047933DB|nr:DNA circularization N-terminal domain-containing protein [Methylomonas sp. 11b]
MTWRDNMQPASLNGIPFFVDSAGGKFGRRYVLHEYPGRDKPFPEDMGRKARMINVQAFVIGNDYMDLRDDLIEEAEKPGAKRLVHPWLGRLDVTLLDCDLEESTREGGMAVITFSFVEAGADVLPAAVASAPVATIKQAQVAELSVMDSFSSLVNFAPSSYLQGHMQSLVGVLDNGLAGMIGGLPMPGGLLDSALSSGEAMLLNRNPLSAVMGQLSSPAGLVSAMVSVASGSTGLLSRAIRVGYSRLLRAGALNDLGTTSNFYGGSPVPAPSRAVAAQSSATPVPAYSARPMTALRLVKSLEPTVAWPAVPAGTAGKQQAAINQAATLAAINQISVIEQARLSAALAYPTKNDAYAVRDYIANRLAAQAKSADYPVYSELQKLRAAVHKDLTARGNANAGLTTVSYNATLSALTISYQHFGTATRETEILARNPNIAHPAMIAGGSVLEVLSA